MSKNLICLLFWILSSLTVDAGSPSKALKTLFGLGASGVIAVKATGEAVAQADIVQEKDNILEALKAQGLKFADPSIYSLYFNLDSKASSVYWADFNKPDVFALITIQGDEEYVIPHITYEYSGQSILERIVRPEIPSGRKIIIQFRDDDTTGNIIWNSILQTAVHYRIDLNADASSREKSISDEATSFATELMHVSISANGKIQLLKSDQILDAHDYIGSIEFTVPDSPDSTWVASGRIKDGKGREVGNATFQQVWKPRVLSLQAEMTQKDIGKAKTSMIFWGGIAVVFGLIFIKLLFFKNEKNENQ